MKLWIVVVSLAVLSGCAPVYTEAFRGPNGKPAYSMECDEIADCYQMAGQLCPSGYSVVGNSSNTTVVPLATGGSFGVTSQSVAIECKEVSSPPLNTGVETLEP